MSDEAAGNGRGHADGASPHVLPAADLVDLAVRLRALEPVLRLADAPAVAQTFGWRTLASKPRWVLLDAGFGPGSGKFHAEDGTVVRIEVRLTDFAADDPEGHAWVAAAFDDTVEVLTGAIGTPDPSTPGVSEQARWIGPETTLVLRRSPVSVLLSWVTNTRLAADDRNIELEDQGSL
ncbi:DUF6301 family protein [Nocardia sp. NPDC005366]|uniref:DUF6301 family protein n=1 Tax=Nocardia sp. NPDC005366 TaxID=3156878 RepID=UPI0033A59623